MARVRVAWRAPAEATGIHVVEQATDVARDEIGLQSPRCIGVTEDGRQIRNIAKQHALVTEQGCRVGATAVDVKLGAAQHLQV